MMALNTFPSSWLVVVVVVVVVRGGGDIAFFL